METNFKMTVEYDGTAFSGWQRQNDRPTIQGEIETALTRILNQHIRISGSGRTDAGVHARAQVASFHARTDLTADDIKQGVNALVKGPIVIRDCIPAEPDFHAQYSARSKEYHYCILNRETPCAIGRNYQWHVRKPLSIDIMNQCCAVLIGEFDFKSFENTGSPRTSTVRRIMHAGIVADSSDRLLFKIRATGFLKYMVRNIVGTLVQAGLEKITPADFNTILTARDRTVAGPTAPPHGLFLHRVYYS